MNLANQAKSLLYANFNQDFSCFSIGTRSGYQLFSSEPLGKTFNNSDGGIGIVEMLFSISSIVAISGGGDKPAFSRNVVRLLNTKRGTLLSEMKFPTPVLAIRLNRKRMIVILERSFGIYDMSNMKALESFDTTQNKQGVCALSPNHDRCYFAYPGEKDGTVSIIDALTATKVIDLSAHNGSIQALSFNSTGSIIATASEKGTLIRIFSLPNGEQTHQFRRGTYPATIYSLSFNSDSTLLAVSSDSDTIHIFKLNVSTQPTYAWSLVDTFLPTHIHNIFEPARNFAHIKLPAIGESCICGFVGQQKILAITSEGTVLIFTIDTEKGGPCTFVSGHSITEI